ncbi:glycosyltransferase family 2 protein [Algoriphagus lutimaris]|uniref:glycosyltransferase family 2 protein n=1 Tax=Algoriphagus lutimaris TaxID=613197 RepID=UPI00196A3DE8|nr:glycosyltransferase family A protein [Algoriphagus lutimaris]MBN3518749.1 glycosyltransferase family 2 protein [Algoriphagus lutimaris]
MFSVIIPLYNKASFISRAIDSVMYQTFQEFEIIVVNDGSTDGGEKLPENYKTDRIRVIHQENQGVSAARNAGIAQARCSFVAFLDADDYWHKDYLKITSEAIKKFQDVGVIGSHYSHEELPEVVENPEVLPLTNYFSKAIHNTFYSSSSTIIRKDFFDSNEGFKTYLKIGEDLDLWFRTIAFFGKAYLIRERLVFYDLSSSESGLIKKNLAFSVLSEFLKDDYLSEEQNAIELESFKRKFILFNLFEYYSLNTNKSILERLLEKVGTNYSLIGLFYRLPGAFLKKYFSVGSLSNLFRNYMKFCFRYIYS